MLLAGAYHSFTRMLQHDNPVLAAGYFLKAADLSLVQDRYREAALRVKDALRMYCRDRQRLIVMCVYVSVLSVNSYCVLMQHGANS